MKSILITDSLFIFPEHVQQLKDAGYEVVRLDKPEASEDELCEAIKGKTGYILGGIEKVTKKVIDSADSLEAIVFTGIGYKNLIVDWKYATEKGIAIANTPDGPTQPVAEWAMTAALAMNRGMFELGIHTDDKTFLTTPGLAGQTVGIIGLGRIGGRIAEMLQPFNPSKILYNSAHKHEDIEQKLGIRYTDINEVLEISDVVFLCVSDEVGHGFFTADYIASMKKNALLVSFMADGIIDIEALYIALSEGKIRAISDHSMDDRFKKFNSSNWFSFKASNAFNTSQGLALTSSRATEALINLLTNGKDEGRVN